MGIKSRSSSTVGKHSISVLYTPNPGAFLNALFSSHMSIMSAYLCAPHGFPGTITFHVNSHVAHLKEYWGKLAVFS